MRYINPVKIVSAGSLAADYTQPIGTAIAPVAGALGPVHQLTGFAFQAIWTGTPVGNFKLQCSCDGGTTWDDIPGTTQAAGGGAGHWTWDYQGHNFDLVRLAYTRSSGTGSVDVWFNGKGIA